MRAQVALILWIACLSSTSRADLSTPTIEESTDFSQLLAMAIPTIPASQALEEEPWDEKVHARYPSLIKTPDQPESPADSTPPRGEVGAGSALSAMPNLWSMEGVPEAYKAHLLDRLRRENEILDERRQAIAWNRSMSTTVAITVHVLVLIALAASGIEFVQSARTRAQSKDPAMASEISLSMQGVAVKSSVIGLCLLTLALGFYALFVLYVYPVVTIGK